MIEGKTQNVVDMISEKLTQVHDKPRILVMSPDHIAELREYLDLDVEKNLLNYKGMIIAISESIDEIEII